MNAIIFSLMMKKKDHNYAIIVDNKKVLNDHKYTCDHLILFDYPL